jgi:RNA polymerase sigma-70 factor (ECF subfamily)
MDTLDRFAAGDLDAFEVLFRQYQGEVYGWIVRIVRNPAAAQELTIDTFWRIYRRRRWFDPRRPFGPWARRIATRLAIDYLKTASHSVEFAETVSRVSEPDPAIQAELRHRIGLAFFALPVRLRVAAALALIEERPYREIAEALNISLSAVKMRVTRAVHQLRANLERMGIRP